MSKKHQQTRSVANRSGVAIEQQTIVDDNLLPPAEELEKLKQIDPSIIQWIMQRAEKEQETRLSFNTENIRLAHRNMGATQASLWLAFVLAMSVLALSGIFIYLGKEVAGTILGGVGILVVIQSFLKFGRSK
jgi:uncharacterized membrane protein